MFVYNVMFDGTRKAELYCSPRKIYSAHTLQLSCSSSSKKAAFFNLMTKSLPLQDKLLVYCECFLRSHPEITVQQRGCVSNNTAETHIVQTSILQWKKETCQWSLVDKLLISNLKPRYKYICNKGIPGNISTCPIYLSTYYVII